MTLVAVHVLQNYAPSNLNRDDTGTPKDAVFGGQPRARISSQSWKRAMRRSDIFRDEFQSDGLLSSRTRLFPRLLRDALEQMGAPAGAVTAIVARAPEFGRESKKDGGDTDEDDTVGEAPTDASTAQLIFLADDEVHTLAQKLLKLYDDKGAKAFSKLPIDELARALGVNAPRSVDIAMFGRMTTSAAFEDVHAAVQVAHPISTHRVQQEFDYYSAVDDISGESGAGFIGDTVFNSATYYKYLSVHWEGLVQNVADTAIAERAVRALIRAAVYAHPSGKQNSFAAHNLPDLVLVEVRTRNVPVSYANAFLKPVRAGGQRSLMDASAEELATYMEKALEKFDIPARRAHVAMGPYRLPDSDEQPSIGALLNWLQLPPVSG